MTAVETVEAEVRELVRRRGLDPVEDKAAARRLVNDVVADYDERALTSTLAPLSDRVFVARHGRSELTTTILSEQQVRDLVERMLKTTGRRVDMSSPFVDAILHNHPGRASLIAALRSHRRPVLPAACQQRRRSRFRRWLRRFR